MGRALKKNNYFASKRWDAGIENKLQAVDGLRFGDASEITGVQFDGDLNAAVEPTANLALRYYDRRIKAYFAAKGVDLGDDILTVDVVREKINSSSGLEIKELTIEAILNAVEEPIAKAVSKLLGFVVTKIFDKEKFKEQVKDHVRERLEEGEGGGVLHGKVLHDLRDAATWARAGVSAEDRRRILNRAYQRRYRRGHAQTWVA